MQDQSRKEGTPPCEPCPIFPGRPQKLNWSIPDPAKATGTDTEINAAFDQAFFLLKERIEALRT
jgi:arsenate reductase